MTTVCHSVVRASTIRVTRLDGCGAIVASGCDYAVAKCFTEVTLNKVLQDRQDAFEVNANGDICVDKPKAPQLRWYEVGITFTEVDPELFNIVSAEPLILNDAAVPEAVGWCTLPESAAASNFAFEFWAGTDDEETCTDADYGYGFMPRVVQGMIGNVTLNNGTVSFTVSAITKIVNQWGVGPYNVLVNETGVNAGFPGPLLSAANVRAHKCFFWTKLPPPPAACGCQDIVPVVDVLPLSGASPLAVTLTIPTGIDGELMIPGVVDWGDGSALEAVTSGTTVPHSYTVPGTYNALYKSTAYSAPTYTSADIVVS